jgi:hypothetical protein
MRDHFPKLESLLRAIAPVDLADVPIYFVCATDAPGLASGDFAAFVSPNADVIYRDCIDGWRGRGIAVVVNEDAVEREACERGQSVWRSLVAICLHEIAHILEDPIYLSFAFPETPPERLGRVRRVIAEYLHEREVATIKQPTWHDHGPRFFQAAEHVRYRAAQLGEAFAPSAIVANYRYIRAATNEFAVALGDEPHRCRNDTFADIRGSPLPAAFQRLWNERASEFFESLVRIEQSKGRTKMSVTLDRIRRAKSLADGEKNRAYLQLVRDTAAGVEVDPDEAAATLDVAGKTVEDLEADAAKASERRHIVAELDKMPALRKQLDELKSQIRDANERLEAERKRYDEATKPKADLIRNIDSALRQEGALRQKLQSTCIDTEAVAAWQSAKAALGEARRERDTLGRENRRMVEMAGTSAGLASQQPYESRGEQHRVAALRQTSIANDCSSRLDDVQVEIERLEKAEAAARAAVEAA